MPLSIIDGKMRQKRSLIAGVTPEIGPSENHLDGSWTSSTYNQIYAGEYFFNIPDERLWIGNSTGVTEIIISGTSGLDNYTTGTTVAGDTAFFDTLDTLSAYTLDLSSVVGGESAFSGQSVSGNISTVAGTAPINNGTQDSIALYSANIDTGTGCFAMGDPTFYKAYIGNYGSETGNINSSFAFGPSQDNVDKGINASASIALSYQYWIKSGSTAAGIFAGRDNTVGYDSTRSVIIGGSGNTIDSFVSGSTIIGGTSITAQSSDTAYVPHLNIETLPAGTSVNNLGIDSSGNVIIGSGGAGANYYTTGATLTDETAFFDRTDGLSAYSLDLSAFALDADLPWSSGTGNYSAQLKDSGSVASGEYSIAGGKATLSTGARSATFGQSTEAFGQQSTAFGNFTYASGTNSFAGGMGHDGSNRIFNNGSCSFAFFGILGAVGNRGIYGNFAAILGGVNNNIGSGAHYSAIIGGYENAVNSGITGATVFGGTGLTATTDDTSYFANVNIGTVGTGTLDKIVGVTSGGDLIEAVTYNNMSIAVSDETTQIVIGTDSSVMYAPHKMTLTDVKASLSTSGSTASTFDINVNGSTILSTKITIDANEHTSGTAATPPVISSASISEDDRIGIDIDGAGTGAAGAKIYLIFKSSSTA